MTTIKNHYPIPRAVPGEPGVLAHYAPCMAVRGAIRDQSGNAADLARTGTPLVAQGNGIRVIDDSNSYWSRAVFATGGTNFSYAAEYELTQTPNANRYFFNNGNHLIVGTNGGAVQISADGGGTTTTTAYSIAGRGPCRPGFLFDGINQVLTMNGVLVGQTAVGPAVPAGSFILGRNGVIRRAKIRSMQYTVAQERADYVSEFARQILWQWTPHREFASILTGTTGGDDDWYCPVGAATMGIVWRPDLSHPQGGRLALTDSQAVNLNRIEFPFRRPWFGSWLIEYQVRDPATDAMIIGFAPTRGVAPYTAGSNAYWIYARTVPGPWWRVSVYLANGVQIDAADAAFPGPVAGDRCKALVSRAVDGTIQVYQQTPTGWWWSAATGNDVNVLTEGFISIGPRGSYVERVTYFQGEMNAHELGV